MSPAVRLVTIVGALAIVGLPGLEQSASTAETSTLNWRSDLAQARAEARALDRLLWVQFTGSWCHQCRRMEAEVFSDTRRIGALAGDFLPVKLQADQHEDLALGYGLTSLPAGVILGSDGAVLAKYQGFLDLDGLSAVLERARQRAGRPAARSPIALEPVRFALQGNCPVSLVETHRLVPGLASLETVHDGRRYRFASAGAQARFQSNPERFAPVNRGDCPVSQVDRGESRPGVPRFGVLYEGHLYLCASAAARDQFLAQAERYARVDIADRGFCPHCWAADRLLVRGQPACSLTRDGRRYLFPDPAHREAFLVAPSASLRR